MHAPHSNRTAGRMFLLCGLGYLGLALATRQTVFITLGPALIGLGAALLAPGKCRP